MNYTLCAIAIGCLVIPGSAAGEEKYRLAPFVEGEIAQVDVSTPQFAPTESADTVQWVHEFDKWPRSRFLRLHFGKVMLPDNGTAKLVIEDRSGNVVDSIQGAALKQLSGRWSKVIPSGYAVLSLVGDHPPESARVEVKEVAHSTGKGTSLSIIGNNDMQDVAELMSDPVVSSSANSVAKLSFVTDGGSAACTGFMVSNDLLMTNNHCISTKEECATGVAIFGYQRQPAGALGDGLQYPCIDVVDTDYDLDYSLLRLASSPGEQWGFLTLSTAKLNVGERAFIVEHPGGRPKMVAETDCSIAEPVASGRAENSDLAHTCDTEEGSSGSPILRLNGQVIALHHFGIADAGQYWNMNRAVLISKIVGHIGGKAQLTIYEK